MKIAVVSIFFSEGMGYSENCLPRALASLGHDVHLITSVYNVYGNQADYATTYQEFLGPNRVQPGSSVVDGYTVHRLDASVIGGYVVCPGLAAKVSEIAPDVVHSLEIASLQTFQVALLRMRRKFALFCETHQHMSVARPFLKRPGSPLRKTLYRMTRTWPTSLASRAVERCYAIAPDCVEVAIRFYGVPDEKVRLQSLGADTDLFHPVEGAQDGESRLALRERLGFLGDDIVCVYSGRFSQDKNPLVLAQAIDVLHDRDPRFRGLFIGEGVQKSQIAAYRSTVVMSFMKHSSLAEHYRAADIAVWPTQESMSMLDAAASGIPIVVSNKVGEKDRVEGNGRMYQEGDVSSMVAALSSLSSSEERAALGAAGRRKMVAGNNWKTYARVLEADFEDALRSGARHTRRPPVVAGDVPRRPVPGTKTRVLIVQNEVPSYRRPVYNALGEHYDVTVLHSGPPGTRSGDLFRESITTKKAVWQVVVQRGVVSRLDKSEFDVAIVMFDLWWLNNIRAIFRRGRPPMILWGHRHSLNRVANWIRYWAMKHADAHLLYGDEDMPNILDHGIQPEKVFIAPNTMFVSNSQDTSGRSKHRLLFVGRLQKTKRVNRLIEAFADALPRIPDTVVLSIVGSSFEEHNLRSQAKSLGIDARVQFHGELRDDSELLPLFAESLVYVSPGFVGLGVLHAFAYGVPVVTTTNPQHRHAQEFMNLRDGVNALIVPSEDRIADALVRLCNDPAFASRLGAAAYRAYQETRRPDQMIDGFRACIEYVTRET
jgi:glycosyltransferase involved in cell wall biosynthesis